MNEHYVIGIDFGTDSVRAIINCADNGIEVASSVCYYERWKKGLYCDPVKNQFRQHPLDYMEGLEIVIKECLKKVHAEVRKRITGISVATTGSTPVAVNDRGVPLGLLDSFRDNPNAMFVLWKDHTAIQEAEEINEAAKRYNTNYQK